MIKRTLLLAGLLALAGSCHGDALTFEQRARREKCAYLVSRLYPNKGRANFLPYVGFLCSEHERLAASDKRGAGFEAAWFYSLVYGAADFGLRCFATAPGAYAGPMDVKHSPLVMDPEANIRWHCREMFGFYKRGVRGRDLCESVFYPARPRDWGGGRFRRTEALFRRTLAHGYATGKLGKGR